MKVSRGMCILVAAVLAIATGTPRVQAQDQGRPDLAGRWTLDRDMSQFPSEVGFGVPWVASGASASSASGERRSGGGRAPERLSIPLQSLDDAKRVQQLTVEVSSPPAHLTITQTQDAVTITDDRGHSRTFRPDGRSDVVQLDDVPAGVTARWDAGHLVVVYAVEKTRELRYSYSRTLDPPQLVVDAQFVDRGRPGELIRRIYQPTSAAEKVAPPPVPPAAAPPSASGAAVPAAGQTPPGAPAPAQPLDQRPDAELRGITHLGLVVEGLTSQAAACGLAQDALESAISKRLTDAGFTVRVNSDEDTYLYVNVMTTSLPNGLCVSRYDAALYSYTAATMSYQKAPVLVQVELLRKGGIAGGPAAAHAAAVLKSLGQYVDQFVERIRNASR